MSEERGPVEVLQQMLQYVAALRLDGPAPEFIDVIGLAEDVKNALAGLQAHASVGFDRSERDASISGRLRSLRQHPRHHHAHTSPPE